MSGLKTYTINNKKYYKSDEVKLKYPKLFKRCPRTRDFIRNKEVPNTRYIYARPNDKQKWIVSDGKSCRHDKVFLLKSWMDKKYLGDDADKYISDIRDAPNIIELEDHEKMTDTDGNILDIEVRGDRECDKCYFKVQDIMNGFGLKSLHKVILNHSSKGFVPVEHYVYFKVDRYKKLFLTCMGMLRFLGTSRIENNTSFTIFRWLQLFMSNDRGSFVVNPKYKCSTIGYAYCVTSDLVNAVKIGFWTGTLETLRGRYVTLYGNSLTIFTVYTTNAYELEQQCHKKFARNRISNELFDKEYWNSYTNYLEENKVEPTTNTAETPSNIVHDNKINFEFFKPMCIFKYNRQYILFDDIKSFKIDINELYDVYLKVIENKIRIFVSCTDIQRILYEYNHESADEFLYWSIKNIRTVRPVISAQKPCIYLFSIGTVHNLKTKFEIEDYYDDDDHVYKWGITDDLEKTTEEYNIIFGRDYEYNLELVLYKNIEPEFISEATAALKSSILNGIFSFDYYEHAKLAIVPNDKMKFVRERFNDISKKYLFYPV